MLPDLPRPRRPPQPSRHPLVYLAAFSLMFSLVAFLARAGVFYVAAGTVAALLRHFLAAIAYRTQTALRRAPEHFANFSAGHHARTPVELLRHMTSLMGYARTLFLGGSYPVKPDPLPTFEQEIARFHENLQALGNLLASETPLREISTEQLLQGPFADVMTHVGQLALLRRLADSPVAPENFIYADIQGERLDAQQAPPARPDKHWPERPQ